MQKGAWTERRWEGGEEGEEGGGRDKKRITGSELCKISRRAKDCVKF